MDRAYLVVSYSGEYEDYCEKVEKAFTDIKKAEIFMEALKGEEQFCRDQASKCRECMGLDKTCPFWSEPYDNSDECEAYDPWHDEINFRIDEVELVE